ncbi:hypothetical protein Ciccas_001800 [Cichlidogyrus casuarinus]|uniref:Uncharacterized protein n=1 Tax=Cichlidogyrus casuarinus TaxID=1844966 RepID=A0ABD2QJ35_9PLAT
MEATCEITDDLCIINIPSRVRSRSYESASLQGAHNYDHLHDNDHIYHHYHDTETHNDYDNYHPTTTTAPTTTTTTNNHQ